MSDTGEWVVYRGETGSKVEHKVYCESWVEWEAYLRRYPYRKGVNKMVARGLTQKQAEAMVQMTQEEY
jgi:hypothetical protein